MRLRGELLPSVRPEGSRKSSRDIVRVSFMSRIKEVVLPSTGNTLIPVGPRLWPFWHGRTHREANPLNPLRSAFCLNRQAFILLEIQMLPGHTTQALRDGPGSRILTPGLNRR